MVDRIKQIMDYKGMTSAIFAETIGINRSNLTHLFSGRNQPSLDLVKKILHAFPDIKTEWLISGVGNMIQEITPQVAPETNGAVASPQVSLFPELFDNENETAVADAIEEIAPEEKQPETTEVELQKAVQVASQDAVVQELPNESIELRPQRKSTTRNRANIPTESPRRTQKFDSRDDKMVKKIVFFYEDNTFETFYPQQ
ncbi:MAG: helix-turn-helix domain-containing protein [Bacteroidales bacterium]|nr:helix-turn-helix domain-containing protein [Bacteroidales bacterium]